jgi:transcriptional regulator with XRE-family HTH domain
MRLSTSERLHALRERAGVTLFQAAKALNISESHLCRIERGQVEIDADTATKIEDAIIQALSEEVTRRGKELSAMRAARGKARVAVLTG